MRAQSTSIRTVCDGQFEVKVGNRFTAAFGAHHSNVNLAVTSWYDAVRANPSKVVVLRFVANGVVECDLMDSRCGTAQAEHAHVTAFLDAWLKLQETKYLIQRAQKEPV